MSSCVCVVIPNLTRAVCSYAFIKNVVTHKDYRAKGSATECLNFAKQIAKAKNCYKMMLFTGTIEVCTDHETKAMLWRDKFELYYPKGVENPGYCVYRLTAQSVKYYHGLANMTLQIKEIG